MRFYSASADPGLCARVGLNEPCRRFQSQMLACNGCAKPCHRVVAVLPGAAARYRLLADRHLDGITGADHRLPRFRLAHLLAVAGLHIASVMGFALMLRARGSSLSERASLSGQTKKLARQRRCGPAAATNGADRHARPDHAQLRHACLLTVALLAGGRPVSLRGLGLAAAVLMLIAPQEVPVVSFQIAFRAVLALIAGMRRCAPGCVACMAKADGDGSSRIWQACLTVRWAAFRSAPYGCLSFRSRAGVFILANMIAVPLTALWVMLPD